MQGATGAETIPPTITYRCSYCGAEAESQPRSAPPALVGVYGLPEDWELIPTPSLDVDDELACGVCLTERLAVFVVEEADMVIAVSENDARALWRATVGEDPDPTIERHDVDKEIRIWCELGMTGDDLVGSVGINYGPGGQVHNPNAPAVAWQVEKTGQLEITEHGCGELVARTPAEWVKLVGRGFLCSTEW